MDFIFGIMWIAFIVAIVIGFIWLWFKVMRRIFWWHLFGNGERRARSEYARIKREHPNYADAQISEAEFLHKFVKAGPGHYRAS